MMQAPEPAKRSPWGFRLAVVGGVMILLGAVMMSSQSDSINAAMDPREQHHDEPYTGAGTHALGELNGTCYRLYQLPSEPVMSVEMHRVEGSALVGEALTEKACKLDWQVMAADGTEFVERASWTLNESGEYALVIECEEDCTESTAWLVPIDAIQNDLLSSTWLVVGGAMCCLGILTTPLALVVYFASKPSRAPRVMMVGPEGQLIPITDVNPDHPTLFTQEEQMPQQPAVAPPFSDTAEHQPSEQFVDGMQDVAAGSLLTTEQVYALMRGDVEGAQEHAKTERYQTTTPEDTIQDAANAAAIASWDEGVPLAEPKPVQRTSTTKKRAPAATEPAGNADAWKDWDEQ